MDFPNAAFTRGRFVRNSTAGQAAPAPSSTTVYAAPGESVESLLKRFKKGCQRAGLVKDMRRSEAFVSRSERRRAKSIAARKRTE